MEIKRKVLLEAGHRCAIPHCSHPQVELHHIIPWSSCKEHSAENLIALCPNCHARADRREIDRKSLIQYKLRGRKILENESASLAKDITGEIRVFEKSTFKEVRSDEYDYEIELDYPSFDATSFLWAEEVNAHLKYIAVEPAQYIRNIANEAPWGLNKSKIEDEFIGTSSLGGSFEITYFNNSYLSVRFSFFSYSYGAAHPSHFTKSANFFLNPVDTISLSHFFEGGINHLEEISKAVRSVLANERDDKYEMVNDEWLINGTKPLDENFRIFNILENGLLFTFDEYHIAPYAAGRQEVLVPFVKFSGLNFPLYSK